VPSYGDAKPGARPSPGLPWQLKDARIERDRIVPRDLAGFFVTQNLVEVDASQRHAAARFRRIRRNVLDPEAIERAADVRQLAPIDGPVGLGDPGANRSRCRR
jgi:hypothetical protein